MRIKGARAFIERVLVAAHRCSTSILVGAAVAAAAGGLLVTRVSFDANVLRLLPRESPTVASFQRFLQDFGSLDELYIMFESADAIGEHAELVDAYVAALGQASEIESVDAQLFEPGKDWGYLYDRELHLLGPSAAPDALSRMQGPALDREMVHARDLLSMPSSDVKAYVRQDPLGLLTLLRDRMSRQKGLVSFDPTQQGYVSADGHSRLIIVKPKGAPFDTDFCKLLFGRLANVERTARASVADSADAGAVTIRAAGAYRVSLEAEALIRREGIINSIGSLVLLLLIVFAIFRTPWVLVYGTLPLALAAVLALGLTAMIQGRLSPATSGSAGMLFGLGIDGVVILYMRYLEEREAGATADEAPRRIAGTALSVILAQLTTAATFFALVFIDFPTLQDLGGLVGGGIVLSCALTLVLLPALLARRSASRGGRMVTAPWLGNLVVRHSRAIVTIGLIGLVAGAAASTRLRVDMGLERLQAVTSGSQLEQEVARRFALPTDVLLVINEGDRLESLVGADARLAVDLVKQDPSIAVSGISLLLPPAPTQQAVAQQILATGASLDKTAAAIREAAERAGFRPGAFAPFLERLPRLLDPESRITYEGLVEHGLGSIVSRFVVRRDGRFATATYLYPMHQIDVRALEVTVHGVDPKMQLTGLPAINADLADRFPPQFLKGLGLGSVGVALLIYAGFRTIRHTLLALAPTAVGFIWSAGLLASARVTLDLFSMFAAVTCVGVAVDYGIYVLYRYVSEGARDIRDVLTRTGAAIMIACLTALVGFGTLINSSYAPLRVFGIVSVVTLVCCLAASLLFLPALLVQLERWSPSAH